MQADVLIVGGGLAGLTLALQLKAREPKLAIEVLERSQGPAPRATHKVGESTTEIGALHLARTIGLREYLDREHIPKFGLRFYLTPDNNGERVEVGGVRMPPVSTWQFDRGHLENELMRRAQAAGVHVRQATPVVGLDTARRAVMLKNGEELEGGWVVDATGRARLWQRSCFPRGSRSQAQATVNAAWWRLEGRVSPDTFSGARPPVRVQQPRWQSTNHLLGRGYWIWLIPLPGPSTSIGIVAHEEYHPLQSINRPAEALRWLERHEPQLHDAISNATRLDFKVLKHLAYDNEHVLGQHGVSATGDAAGFGDPLYSQGNDFVAISNTWITDLVCRARRGESLAAPLALFNGMYRGLFTNQMTTYRFAYQVFGNARATVLKLIWDFSVYWGVVAAWFQRTDVCSLSQLAAVAPLLQTTAALNERIQLHLMHASTSTRQEPGAFFDPISLQRLRRWNEALDQEERVPDPARWLSQRVQRLEQLAVLICSSSGTGPLVPDSVQRWAR